MASILSYALCSLADVKESLGIASSNTTMDNLCIRKINQATLAIENYTGRHFKLTTYTDEEYDATNTNQLILRQRPVVTFTSLGARDSGLNSNDWETLDSELSFVDNASGVLDLNFRALGSWNRYRVTYSAGYATIPEDLAEACASLACFYFNNANGSDIGIASKKEGQREVRFANNTQTFTSIIQQLGIDGIINSYANYPILADK